jgi:type II secretory pathway pseudopilin PulG
MNVAGKKRQSKNSLLKSGFSLVEVLAVLFVVSMGLIGILSLIVQSVQVRYINKNAMIAYQLAQEGVELARHVRDTNWRQGESWLFGMGTGQYCIDYENIVPITTSGQGCRLYLDLNGFYDHTQESGDISTDFFRKIEVNAIATTSAQIISAISWQDHGQNYSYRLETTLYDWR